MPINSAALYPKSETNVEKMQIPHLNRDQFAVGQAQYFTGHVLKHNGELFLEGEDENEVYKTFNSLGDAKEFMFETVANDPDIECWIIDFNGQTVFAYDRDGERKLK